jgi:spermidine synthase
MVIEITAARILTPYFGQTVFVWTNLIGIILAALALGNYFGGRLADRSKTLAPLFLLLLLCGTLCVFIPFAIHGTARFFLGEGLTLEEAFPILIRGSFATGLLLFAPPVLLAGGCLPFLVKAAAEVTGKVGRASGSVYGASTLGSIAGTFLSTYVLIELLGSKRTFFAAGMLLLALAATGLLCLRIGRGRVFGVLILLAGGALVLSGSYPAIGFSASGDVIFEAESRYQYVRAIRVSDDPETIHLSLNEGLDSFHSIYVEDDVLTGGQYYDYYGLLPALAGLDRLERVCIIGLAAGTTARQYQYFYGKEPGLEIDGVEIDPVTVEVGRELMGLDSAKDCLRSFNDMDGRIFLEFTSARYDVMVIDAYAQQVYIPFHMTTKEFFELVNERLKPGGIVGMNVSGYTFSDRLLRSVANTAASVFGSVAVAKLPEVRNFMIYAVKGRGYTDPGSAGRLPDPARLDPLLQAILPFGLCRKFDFDPSGDLLRDDYAPVEVLCDQDLIARARKLMEQVESLER